MPVDPLVSSSLVLSYSRMYAILNNINIWMSNCSFILAEVKEKIEKYPISRGS